MTGDPVQEIVPRPPPPSQVLPRVVGPGRRERAYLEKQLFLQAAIAAREKEIETISLVERGSARRLDRMERKLAAVREAAAALDQKEKRLILALGALQRENEILRERLALALPAPAQALTAHSRKRSFLARLLRRP